MEANKLIPIMYEAFLEKFREAGYPRVASVAEFAADGRKEPFYLAALMKISLKLWETGEIEVYEGEEEGVILERIVFDLEALAREISRKAQS